MVVIAGLVVMMSVCVHPERTDWPGAGFLITTRAGLPPVASWSPVPVAPATAPRAVATRTALGRAGLAGLQDSLARPVALFPLGER
jgi:hypothetical protein